MSIFGSKELERTFKTLGERVQRKVMRPAVSAAATPVVKAAKANAPKQSGTLRKSLGKKIVTNAKKQSVTAVIGPRRGVVGEYQGEQRKPSRYAHLVEKGHVDKSGRFIPPKPFLNPALTNSEPQSLSIMQSKMAAGIVKEAAKQS